MPTMLETCILLAFIPVVCSGDYYQQELSPKNLRMFYYARKIQPGYHDRMHYHMKSPFRRPYMVYVPKPYVVEVPKPVPYVKIPVPQQYYFEKQLSHPYKIEKPLYFHQLSSSLDTKVPTDDHKVPIDSPVSVTVEKQVLLPVTLGGDKQTETKQPSAYMTIPEEVTSHLELAMNKEQPSLSSVDKESFLEQLKANGLSQEDLRSQFVLQGEHKPFSSGSELPKSWSTKTKTSLEPIVVSEEPQKWTSFNGSEWIPRFEIKTMPNEKYKILKPEKENFDFSEIKYPIHGSILSQDISKYLLPEKSSFVPSSSFESAKTHKQSPFEQPSKHSFDLPNSKTYQYYTLDSGKVIKPEALTSNIGNGEIEAGLKDGIRPYHKWLISKSHQKDSQNTIPDKSEPNLKWISAQESYTGQNEPAKKWQTNNGQHAVRTEPAEQFLRNQEEYEGQNEFSQQWSIEDTQAQHQRELDKKWTNGHGQYIIQNDSDNVQSQQSDQSDPTVNWAKNVDQYIIKKKPRQHWLKSEETTYSSQKYLPQSPVQEEEGLKTTTGQSQNEKAYSSQKYLLSPQHATDNKGTLQSEKYDHQDQKYFHASQPLEGNFKPLIPSHSQIFYRYQVPHSENNFYQEDTLHRQEDFERKPSHQQEIIQYSNHNRLQPQSSDPETQEDLPSTKDRQVYQLQQNAVLKADNLRPTSNRNHKQHFRNHQYYQQAQDVRSKNHEALQVQGGSVQSYPEYASSPQRHRDYWEQTSQAVYQENTGGGNKDGPSIADDSEEKDQLRQQGSGSFGQKRRQRQPSRGETRVPDQKLRSNRVSITNTTEELTTPLVPSSTTSQTRRKHRRKQRRRNQETTTYPNEK